MIKLKILLVPFIFLMACRENAEKNDFTEDRLQNNKEERLDFLFTKEFSGTVLIAEKGKVIYTKTAGLANEETQEKIALKTIFELASVSKQFTAMGIVQLQKEGKLSYDDELGKHIPELSFYNGITIEHLLTHTSGLPDYFILFEAKWDKSKIATNEDVIALFQKLKPKVFYEPNEVFEYSNTGYVFLASIIERVSGQSFKSYLKSKIFDKLKMNDTYVYGRFYDKSINNYALGYSYSDSLQRKALPEEIYKNHWAIYMDGIHGDGSVDSNVFDLLKWDRALYGNNLVNEQDKALIFKSHKTSDGKETNKGFGWNIWEGGPYGKVVSHPGGWVGYLTYIERHIDTDKTVIILMNNEDFRYKIPQTLKDIREILYAN